MADPPVASQAGQTGAKAKRWLEGAQKRKEALLIGGAGVVIAFALYARKRTGAQQGATAGTGTSTTGTPVPTADTTANDLYNALFDNLINQLRASSAGAGSPSGAISGSSSGGSGGAGSGPGPSPSSMPPSSAMPQGIPASQLTAADLQPSTYVAVPGVSSPIPLATLMPVTGQVGGYPSSVSSGQLIAAAQAQASAIQREAAAQGPGYVPPGTGGKPAYYYA